MAGRRRKLESDKVREIISLYGRGRSIRAIARTVRVSRETVRVTLKSCGIALRPRGGARGRHRRTTKIPFRDGAPSYVPTPDEIAAKCAEIRAGWSAQTERSRRAYHVEIPWEPPLVDRHEAS